MTRTLISASLALLASLSLQAAISTPSYFYEDFKQMAAETDQLSTDWTTYGNGLEPSELAKKYVPEFTANPPYFLFLVSDNITIPMCLTNYEGSQPAHQWLITPEVEIADDAASLSFLVGVNSLLGALGNAEISYRVLISESGVQKSDFAEEAIYAGSLTGSKTRELVTQTVITPLNGYKGKRVHVAFVVDGTDGGLMGFTNIGLGAYTTSITNQTATVCDKAMTDKTATETVRINLGLKTPVECNSVKAVLEAQGKTSELTFDKDFYSRSGLTYQDIKFTDAPLTFENGQNVSYTVTITPDYEGAPSSVVAGIVAVPVSTYLNNVVAEEGTATTCQYCPSGIGAFDYYAENYPGTADTGKFIGIAVHVNGSGFTDPMGELLYSNYATPLMTLSSTSSLPFANFNRSTPGSAPTSKNMFELLIARPSFNQLTITGVEAPEDADIDDEVTVSFSVRNAYEIENRDLRAAIVLIENDVAGFDSSYNQQNAFSKYDDTFISQNYGDWLVPYMKEFLRGGSLASSDIRFDKIKYQHVARGIFPQFDGTPIQSAWKADVAQQSQISFTIPENVMYWDNTEIVALLFDGETNAIVASDIIPFKKYNTSVATLESDSKALLSIQGHGILNLTSETLDVAIYSLDGKLLSRMKLAAGATAKVTHQGIALVRATSRTQTSTMKAIF